MGQSFPVRWPAMPTGRTAAALTLLLVAVAYFHGFFNYGFEWGDVGSYAQVVYELSRGGTPGDYVGYGLLWYGLGLAGVAVAGPGYGTILLTLYGVILGVAFLFFFGTWLATGRVWAALLVALLFVLVPPFPASAVRSLAFGINLLAFLWLARAPLGRDGQALVLAAVAVGVTFMLRPDFGYFFTLCLGLLMAVRSACSSGTMAARLADFLRSALLAAAVIAVTVTPLFLIAWSGGYLTTILDDYLSYPRRILFFILQSPSLANMVGGKPASDAGFLKILPVSALFAGPFGGRVFAFLIYSTMLGLALFAVHALWGWVRRPGDVRRNLLTLTVLMLAGSQWPIFAFFRPAWIHFATFMHGYLVLAAVAAAGLLGVLGFGGPARSAGERGRGSLAKALAAAGLFVLAAQAVLFVVHGVQVPGVGALAQREGRDVAMSAGHGVDVMVSAAEKRQYETIDALIRAHSRPEDRIVCVPYCPGYAFMAERRMLFKEHYVDDNTPNLYPGWIDRAIALTEAERPPVILVQDWAPNQTEASRFAVWAAPYMAFVRSRYPGVVPFPGGTAYLAERVDEPSRVVQVQAYGPQATPAGVPFNRQPDGASALWMSVPGLSGSAQVRFDGAPLASAVAGDVISALIPVDRIAAPGRHWLEVVDPASGLRTEPVPFDVTGP
ncbi:hypothetical protein FH063_002249 [Azospirillum argentinense]|uniref:Glycosyltransferase RgtA/B/C/D-like domain-containing protein n=2 Tax=Azospirillum argentinense TaxID=2970906 RepID=A0A5B0KT67_9PROT|nr:hypothetical protein FH063_002249 [Azospirillum argentinense]